MRLLVDGDSLADHPELEYLLSFGKVEGFSVDSRIAIVDRPGREPCAVIGEAGTHLVSILPPDQTRRLAAKIASSPSCMIEPEPIARAIALDHVGCILKADLVVSAVAGKIPASDAKFFRRGKFVSVPEALAVIGAYGRQRDPVPLAGSPPLAQVRSEVYRATARWIVAGGPALWALAGQNPAKSEQLQRYVEATLDRVGQALRGRDGVQEALRLARDRSGLEDALYHFDVVLTSSVAALDSLARFAHVYYGLSNRRMFDAGWQKPEWIKRIGAQCQRLTEVVDASSRRGAQLRIITKTRNTIHGIPLREVLHVEPANRESPVEHRIEMTSEVADGLRRAGAPIQPLSDHGLFVGAKGAAVLNVAVFTEDALTWLLSILDDLITAMRESAGLNPARLQEPHGLAGFERECLIALARVGEFPVDRTVMGLRASPSLTLKVTGTRARALKKIQEERT